MNRSYNKLRHINESNERLERRFLLEKNKKTKGEVDEGLFGPSKAEKEELKKELMNKMEKLLGDSEHTESDLYNTIESVLKRAKESNYKGKVKLGKTSKGKPMFIFTPELTTLQKIASGTGRLTTGA